MRRTRLACLCMALLLTGPAFAATDAGQPLPTGMMLTPLAAPGAKYMPLVTRLGPHPSYIADGASAIAVSSDHKEMLVLTSGFNRYVDPDGKIDPAQSQQYVFVYRISDKGSTWQQTLRVPNSFSGIAWLPDGNGFVVGGGMNDDVHVFTRGYHGFTEAGKPIALGHTRGNGVRVKPQAAGVAVSPDGKRILVANYYNDSVSLVDLATRKVVDEQDLRPGKIDPAAHGIAGGEYPYAIVWVGPHEAWVSAARDRQLVKLSVSGDSISVDRRIPVIGQPTFLLFDPAAHRLFATEDNSDRLAIVDLSTDRLVAEPRLGLPDALDPGTLPKGLNLNSLALLPDHQLLVTYGGANAVALVTPHEDGATVDGLVPTAWYPSAVATSADGKRVFVVNRKTLPGPNPKGCVPRMAQTKSQGDACGAGNEYIYQMEKAGLLTFPLPEGLALAKTSRRVADNIGLGNAKARAAADAKMALLRKRIKHVVYIIKENRTYDQVLGDLPEGNGDPHLAILGRALSPNHHALAMDFVDLDNFYASGEQSSTGWTWSTAGRTTDLLEKTAPVNYAGRGLSYEAEQASRNIDVELPMAERRKVNPAVPDDPDLLPGRGLISAPDGDGDDEPGQGFLWNAVVRAGLSLRNYGMADGSVYWTGSPGDVPPIRNPYARGIKVYTPAAQVLAGRSDPYFRGFDQRLADFWREREWEREFKQQEANHDMPALTLIRLSHDHFGAFKEATDGVNTVETEMADNDYALGKVVEAIARSPFKDNTLIFVVEDDAQNGTDHVSARRTVAYVIGPYVRHHAVVSTRYTTVSMLRTMEDLLGIQPLGLNDAMAVPMADVFDLNQKDWTYTAHAADVLKTTQLPIPADRFVKEPAGRSERKLHTAAYWAKAMRGQDFVQADHLDTVAFNAALWRGLGTGTQPTTRSGKDLSHDRAALLRKDGMSDTD